MKTRTILTTVGWLGAAMFITSSAFAQCTPATEAEMHLVRGSFEKELLDSESARFTDVCKLTLTKERFETITSFCGLLNAKNSFGAYIGFRPFYSVPQNSVVGVAYENAEPSEQASFAFGHCLACVYPEKTGEECLQERSRAHRNALDLN